MGPHGDVDVRINVDAEYHPVGLSTPWILLFISNSNRILHKFAKQIEGKYQDNEKVHIYGKEYNPFADLDFRILWCVGSFRVRFYIYVHAYVFVFNSTL